MCIVGKIKDGVYCREDEVWCVFQGRRGMVCIIEKIRNGVFNRKEKGESFL